MDVLIALGTSAAYVYSCISIALCMINPEFPGNHFLETCAMLITFVLLGRYMEAHAKAKTSAAIGKLVSLQPSVACLLAVGGAWEGRVEAKDGGHFYPFLSHFCPFLGCFLPRF